MALTTDIVTQEDARNSYLIIGFQVGFMGYIVRLGLYKQINPEQTIKIKVKK
jgi:hypothetical protein